MIFRMWVHDHKVVCHGPQWPSWDLDLWPQGQIIVFSSPSYCHHWASVVRKKQLFDLEIIGQGPTKVITICDTLPYGHAPIYQISLTYLERQKCYGPDKKILFQLYLVCGCMTIRRCVAYRNDLCGTLTSRSNNCFLNSIYLVCGCMTIRWCVTYHNDLCGTLTVKVPWRSLRYATYRLMVMHPYTKYHWPISKDKNVMARTRKYYLKNNYLILRSKSHEGHYGMRHTALRSFTTSRSNNCFLNSIFLSGP
jgi:hypothetical protein